jgi:hypothetical protein
MSITPITITKAAAAKIILAKLEEPGAVVGGAYYRAEAGARGFGAAGARCAIGWLYPEEDAISLEATSGGRGDYKLATCLMQDGELIVDDPDWFATAQSITDGQYISTELKIRLGNHCRDALPKPSMGYDIGNRRSDPVYR